MLCIFDAHKNHALTGITSRMKSTFFAMEKWSTSWRENKSTLLRGLGWLLDEFREKSKLLRLRVRLFDFFYCHANYSLKHECDLNQFFFMTTTSFTWHVMDDIISMFQNSFNTLQNTFRCVHGDVFSHVIRFLLRRVFFQQNFLVLLLKKNYYLLWIFETFYHNIFS